MALAFVAPHGSEELARAEDWRTAWDALGSGIPFRLWPHETAAPQEIQCALAWNPPPATLATFPNLRLIHSLGAGVDHLAGDPSLPRVPIVRMVEPGLTQGVVEFALLHVLYLHRGLHLYREHQTARAWQQHSPLPSWERSVAVLGLGPIGEACARALTTLGFQVRAWSRTPRSFDDLETHSGESGLAQVLSSSEIVVLILPNAPGTHKILNAERLALLPHGAGISNLGRGTLIDETALLAALATGQVAAAALDVYSEEPLPPTHSFWGHPRVLMTPHIAGITYPATAARVVLEQFRRCQKGETLAHLVPHPQG